MAKITFIVNNDEKILVEGDSGNVMQLAVNNNIAGIDGDCGGVCSCATCHVFVAEKDFEKVGKAGEIELEMLELEDYASDFSRLCCQIEVSDAIDGVELTVAKEV
ncbi:2Fe-2S iron-sulfur cluster-binding protein [Aquimarina algicola]|uniref:2Fe-2S iron-sulfur cluster binding domain-containing protein n=1 Tax=Aquimarina algicola TaxID=2589995 RepID=A0A504IWR7_9FLAO|nr:2Fe-2S iron-sulfur cluster-binding protein [Aquimarina algicola]TPN82826.1 2Fe-2S iron-sulfur cluster binding domain-containing protein [Aquimarina algicola]